MAKPKAYEIDSVSVVLAQVDDLLDELGVLDNKQLKRVEQHCRYYRGCGPNVYDAVAKYCEARRKELETV